MFPVSEVRHWSRGIVCESLAAKHRLFAKKVLDPSTGRYYSPRYEQQRYEKHHSDCAILDALRRAWRIDGL